MIFDPRRQLPAPCELADALMIDPSAAATDPARAPPPAGMECHTPQPTPPVDDEDEDEDDDDDDRGSGGGNIDPDDDEGWTEEDDEDEDDTLWTLAR
jgi:hypothetical protein